MTTLILFGIIALSYGFGVYYLLPLSLVSFNFSLAMSIFLTILFGMILAMGIISTNLMPLVNLAVSKIVLIFEGRSLRLLTLKNLIAHQERNKMTSIMYSFTLGFIIFLRIVCKIPFIRELNEVQKAVGTHTINIGIMNLPMAELESVVRKYEYAFEGFGAFTHHVFNKYNIIYF